MSEKFNIKNIDIKSFRGIKNYSYPFNDKSLVLVGENGSGKSSIVNAFEYLFTGKIDSLSGKQSINHDKSLVHIGDNTEDLLIKAEIGDDYISRSLSEGLKYSPNLEDVIEDFKHGSFILNRRKLLNFIENTPNKRYTHITSLIGFDELDEIEKTFNKTQKEYKKRFNDKQSQLEQNTAEISNIYNCEIKDIFDKINEILIKNDIDTISKDCDLNEFLKEFSKTDFERNNKLAEALKSMDININEINDKYQKLLNDYTDMALNELKSNSKLIDILNKSRDIIKEESPDKCPVCNSEIDNTEVISFIDTKKEELSGNVNTLQNWKNDYKFLSNDLSSLNYDLSSVKSKLDQLDYDYDFDLNTLINDLNKLAKFEITPNSLDDNYLTNLNNEFERLKQDILKEFEKINDEKNQSDLNNVYETIFKLNERTQIENELKIIEKQYETSNKTYELFKAKKQKAVENIIEKIEQMVNDYYNFIHIDEDFNSPELIVPKSTGITIKLKFNDELADPRAFSSEGHLDSLGLCIFLAFAKEFNKYEFIILDDIIATVDLGHKERIARLLFEEFRDYRFIITTHSKLWFRQIKNFAENYSLGSNYLFAEIRVLDEATGPVLSKNMFTKETIEKYIEMGDTFAAGNAIRRYLENTFETFCRVNEIPLPLKTHYMVNDYFEAINKFLFDTNLFNSKPECRQYYKKITRKLNCARFMGNLLSHNDDDNYDVTISEVEEFKNAVYAYREALCCPKHKNSFLKFDEKKKSAKCTHRKCNKVIVFK